VLVKEGFCGGRVRANKAFKVVGYNFCASSGDLYLDIFMGIGGLGTQSWNTVCFSLM
jgi:hypothetical protein